MKPERRWGVGRWSVVWIMVLLFGMASQGDHNLEERPFWVSGVEGFSLASGLGAEARPEALNRKTEENKLTLKQKAGFRV